MAAYKLPRTSILLLALSVLPHPALGLTPTALTLAASPNPSTLGTLVTLTATVTTSSTTGQMTFFDGVAILGTKPVSAGTASLSTILLSAGSHKLTAYYRDDVNSVVGISNVVTQTVKAIAGGTFITQTTTLNAAPVGSPADFAVLNIANPSATVLLGKGDGTFHLPVNYALGGSSLIPIAAGDFNRDGTTDLAVATFSPALGSEGIANVSILLANDDGTFQPAVEYRAGGNSVQALAVADFNGDGKADLVLASSGGSTILLGNGDGTFGAPVAYSTLGGPLVVADFNGDGKPDLALGNTSALNISSPVILLGNGDGTAQTPITFSLGTSASVTSLISGDFNGDGIQDLAVGGFVSGTNAPTTWILLGNGDGTFQAAVSYSLGAAAVSGDFNGDGFTDLVVTGSSGNTTGILQGKGDGTFQQGPAAAAGFPLAVADFNDDGRADILTVNAANGTVTVLSGAGNVSLSLTATRGATQSTPSGSSFSFPLQVTVLNNGIPLRGAAINFTAPSSGAGAILSSPTAFTNGSGVASITARSNSVTGSYTVTAGMGKLSASFPLTNTAQPASITATGGTPQSTVTSTAFATALQATVKDSGGNPISNVTVSFAAPPTGASATLSAPVAVTNASGVASMTATANNTAGSYTVTANVGALSASFSLTNTSAKPASVTATGGTPQSAALGTAFATALQATVKDSGGNPLSGVTVTFAAPPTGVSATLSNPSAVTNASGVASVTATANNIAGSYTVTASVGTLLALYSLTNTTTAQPASVTATGGTPQSAPLATAFATALQATVKDSGGNPLSGVTVTFAAPPSGVSATLSSPTAMTNASGIASVTATANNIAGSYNVTANVGALLASFSLTNTSGQPASLTATGGTPQSAPLATAFPNALQATVKDSGGNPLSGVTVTFAAPPTGVSATLSSPTAVTNASGIASVTATANNIAGSYTVTANVGALSASFSLTNTSGQPASVTATGGTPQSAIVGTAFATPLQATVKDSLGNPLSGVTVTFTAPSVDTTASATLSSSTTVTNASGVASVTATANGLTGSYTLTANVGVLSAFFSLINTSGQPASVTATGGTPQSAPLGTAFATALQAIVRDFAGNPLSNVTVTFAAPLSGASATLSSPTAVTNASGVASVTATANGLAGSYTVTAKVGSLSAFFSLTNTSGQPASVTATAGTPQSAIVGTAFATPLQATVKDSLGNPLSNVTVTFAAPLSGASATLSSPTAVTNASGIASVTATANSIAGIYTVTASVGALSASFTLNNTSGSSSGIPASITATGGTPQSAPSGTAFATALQATVKDSAGNPVSGATVTFGVPLLGASAVLSSSSTLTNASGVASVTATANGTMGSYNIIASVTAFLGPGGVFSTNFSLTNTPATFASITATGGTPQSAPSGTAFATALQATVKDSLGNPINGITVTFAAPAAGASAALSSATAVTNLSGVASVSATANNIAGSYLVTATVGSLSASFSLTNTSGGGGGGNSNLALGKTATQSSTFPGYSTAGAASAVDGSTDGNFTDGSVTATNQDPNAWWQVDLGASAAIGSVVIFNRTDCCASRLSDYWVFISDTPFLATDTPATLQNRAGTFAGHQTSAPNPSATITAAAQGRYLRVQLTGTDYLSLAEIQVFGPGGAPPPTNLAQGKTATQSSTFPGFATDGAAAAVDGNTDGNFTDGSVTATNADPNAWWQVDLGASAAVSSITIWNRTDCCGTRLGDYWIFVSDTPFLATDTPTTLQGRAGTFSSHQTSAPNPSAAITIGAQGRYVRIQLTGTNNLSLAEVQVFGTGGAAAPTDVAQGKAASQSSTFPGFSSDAAAAAVDGNTDGNFQDGSVTATNLDPNPWWQVDLGASTAVSSIVIWNRTDCCSTRLGDYWVFVSDTPFLATDTPTTLQGRAGTFSSHQTSAPSPSAIITAAAQGRYVRVQLSTANYLSLAEVQVFGQ